MYNIKWKNILQNYMSWFRLKECLNTVRSRQSKISYRYTLFKKSQAAWYFVRPAQAATWHTVAIKIRVVLVSPYLCIRGVSVFHSLQQSRRVNINQRRQYIHLIWS